MTPEEFIDNNLKFYDRFPNTSDFKILKRAVRMYLPKQNKWTEKGMLSVLRHEYTNYNWIHRNFDGSHSELRDAVNKRILEKVSKALPMP